MITIQDLNTRWESQEVTFKADTFMSETANKKYSIGIGQNFLNYSILKNAYEAEESKVDTCQAQSNRVSCATADSGEG